MRHEEGMNSCQETTLEKQECRCSIFHHILREVTAEGGPMLAFLPLKNVTAFGTSSCISKVSMGVIDILTL